MYNIHPLLVHFPIAFLLLYSLLKILPLDRWLPKVPWRHIQQVVLFFGVLGALVASATGETAEHLVRPNRQIVNMHSFFAGASTWIYGLILIGEITFILNPYIVNKFTQDNILYKIFKLIEKVLANRIITLLLAIVGVFAISLTGLLGGVMVYGTSADPVAPFVLKVLGIQ